MDNDASTSSPTRRPYIIALMMMLVACLTLAGTQSASASTTLAERPASGSLIAASTSALPSTAQLGSRAVGFRVRVPIAGMKQGTVEVGADLHWTSVDLVVSASTAARGYLVKNGSRFLVEGFCRLGTNDKVCSILGTAAGDIVYGKMSQFLQNPCFIDVRVKVGLSWKLKPKIKSITVSQGRCP